ncbi:MAG: PTS system mannose/fructose/sorbose family transporter subunit IID [Erysipelotrichaceae bacterium]|nr:PTS system mannose/fructose/sorbose family transporter subunit IID [Erysipelotrichaceae bacterium]
MTNKETLLTKKDVQKVWFNWMWLNLSTQNMERMQAPAVVRALWTAKDKLYPNQPDRQQDLMARHMEFFNTEPIWGGLTVGIALAIEEEKAGHPDDVPDELPSSIKTALMGPCAGLFDSLFQSTLIPIILAIGIGISSETGSIVGPLLYIALFWAIVPTVSWFLFYNSYKIGLNGVQQILTTGIKDKVISAANVVGLTVIGAVTASTCKINSGLVFSYGEMTINVNNILTGIQPKILVLIMAFVTYHLLSKKRISVNMLMLIMLVISIIGYFTTILA